MEVKNSSSALISNYEVFALLKDIQSGQNGQRKPNKEQSSLATVCFSTLKYLEKTPCQFQSDDVVEKFLKALAPYKFTKAEKLQLLNHRPTTDAEIALIIEECEERLSDEQTEQLLQLISKFLPQTALSASSPMDTS